MRRKGLGTGKGKGYYNIINKDKKVHSDSAKGKKQPQEIKSFQKNLNPEEQEAYQELGYTRFKALRDYLKEEGWEINKFQEEDDGVYQIDCGGAEFLLFDSVEKAEKYAEDKVYDMLEDEPETFNQDFLQRHLYISDTDKRIISQEEADNRVESMSDDELLENAGLKDEYEDLEEKKDWLEEQIDEWEDIKENDDLVKEKNDVDMEMDAVIDKAKEQVSSDISDEIEDKLEDPIEYFVEEEGIYTVDDLMKQPFIAIDSDSASKEAVDEDGWEHFVASYDGESREIKYVEQGVNKEMALARVN